FGISIIFLKAGTLDLVELRAVVGDMGPLGLAAGALFLAGFGVKAALVPAHTWQAGYLVDGGRYALFGCTMAPGFNGACFEAGDEEQLIEQYPEREADIIRLSVNDGETRMPDGFAS
ncbi:MAG: hypothetical protein HGA86_07265, partial [Anaerolineaceae bacterium]|nr:hypothetical protein [Anaerolineaceae bacterium]